MDWTPDYSVTPQRVVCAANQHNDGFIVIGVRHFDNIMRDTINLRKELNENEDWHGCDQGFVNQFGNFLSREDAWVTACKANQIIRLVGSQTKEDIGKEGIKLYSENLY